MILLTEYIIDTQGKIEPWHVLNNKLCYDALNKETFNLQCDIGASFENIDHSYRFYRLRYARSHIYVLNKLGRILYD
jgi:hypothetical protein